MSYRNSRADEVQPLGESMHSACRWCGKSAPNATLMQYGARCLSCWEAYMRKPLETTPDIGDRGDGPKSWAWALRKREMACERLKLAQKNAWRQALKSELREEKAE